MPLKESWTEIDGLRIHYSRAGHGRPLLLLHGLLGGSFCWRFNVEALAEKHSVYAVDLPGSGLSDAPPNADCNMEAQVRRLLEFIRKMELTELSVIASSWGGAIALLLAAMDVKSPEAVNGDLQSSRIHSLVLCAPVNPWSDLGRGRINFFKSHVGGYLLRMLWPVCRPVQAIALNRLYGDPTRIAPGSLDGYVSMILRPARARNTLSVLRSWHKDVELLRRYIAQVKVPTLLVWGTKDGAVDIRSAEMLRQVLPASELALFPAVGHLPFEEVPGEFNNRVLEFLSAK
jgi:pimeloyl-ACP methyl ester carboxylesterase